MAKRAKKYKKTYCEHLVNHMKKGGSFTGFAGHPDIGVGKAMLNKWLIEFPEFAEAKEVGEAACRYYWEERGNAGVFGALVYTAKETIKPTGEIIREKKKAAFNAYAYGMSMRNMFGWSLGDPDISKGELSPELDEALRVLEGETKSTSKKKAPKPAKKPAKKKPSPQKTAENIAKKAGR